MHPQLLCIRNGLGSQCIIACLIYLYIHTHTHTPPIICKFIKYHHLYFKPNYQLEVDNSYCHKSRVIFILQYYEFVIVSSPVIQDILRESFTKSAGKYIVCL